MVRQSVAMDSIEVSSVQDREQNDNPDPVEQSEAPVPPSIVDGEEHHVDWRSVKVARIIGLSWTLLIAMAPLVFLTVGWGFGGIPTRVYMTLLGVVLTLLIVFLLFAFRWPAARHERLRYLVDEHGLRIRRGVFWRKVIWIPITRVQHIDYSQGPVQRSFDLATLTVHTAGTAGASISLAGLELEIAKRLCHHLRPDRTPDAA